MIDRQKFEEAIYSLLFPAGLIPVSCKPRLGLMDSRISEIHSLAQGKGPAPKTRRIMDSTESAELTRKIVELRDGPNSPSWRDIAKELGNTISSDAVRCRYQDAKALQEKAAPALQEAKPKPAENPTIRDSLIVEKTEEVSTGGQIAEPDKKVILPKAESKRQLTPSQRGHLVGPKIPHSEDPFIFNEKESGKTFGEIHKALIQKGHDCTVTDVAQRYYTDLKKRMAATAKVEGSKTAENVAPVHPDVPASQSPPGVEGAQELAREAIGPTRGTPEEKPPTPKSISRAELDAKIWEMYTKEKLTEEEISDRLYAEGLFYSEKSVHIRLISQGAAI